MSRFSQRREFFKRTSPEVAKSVTSDEVLEHTPPHDFLDHRQELERRMGARLEMTFTRHEDLVEEDDSTGIATLRLVKEVKLGEWMDVKLTRATDDEGVRTTELSTWMSMSGGTGWGSAMQYVEKPGDPKNSETSWQPGHLVACRIVNDKKTGERNIFVVPDPEPTERELLLHDPTSRLNIICYGGALLDTLSKSVADKSHGSLAYALRACGIGYIDELKETVKGEVLPAIIQKHTEGVQQLGKAATHATAAIKHRLPGGHRGEQD